MFMLDTSGPPPPSKGAASITISEPKSLEVVENRIYFYSEIDRVGTLTLNRQLRQLSNDSLYFAQTKGTDPYPIHLHINSYGGSIFSGVAVMDEILRLKEKVPIYTIIDGCCASAGTFLSIVGTRRYINKHAYMLIHQLSSVMWGKFEEFKDEMKNLEKLMDMIRGLYDDYSKIPKGRLDDILKHDIWFSPEECLQYGLVDEVI